MTHSKDQLIRDLILLALFAFLLGCLNTGCISAPYAERPPANCKAEPDDFRCKVWIPEPEPKFETANEEAFDEEF